MCNLYCKYCSTVIALLYYVSEYSTLLCTGYPPAVSQPRPINKGPTWVQLGWEPADCNGGHEIVSYDVQYRESSTYLYTTAASVTGFNYTVRDLTPNTIHYFRVVTVSNSRLSYSSSVLVTTHESGMCIC